MAINGFPINGAAINGDEDAGVTDFVVQGFTSGVTGILQMAVGFRITAGLTETFSPVGLFFWNSETSCEFEEIQVADLETDFNSIRDDGNNNRELEKRLRCITGVEVNHICILGDET